MTEKEIELFNKCGNLEAENEKLKLRLKNFEENVELIGKVAFLENDLNNAKAQIEKMKCCENCRYCNKWGEANSNSPNCKKCNWVSNWKLRR